ncbi:MAG: virulence RhuM family protein [Turicibacter sp.]|nr:virulence RhuM family protein [Turicibacter sp.]
MVLKILWGFKRLKESSLLWRQAEREIPMTMKDWINHVDDILKATNENVLTNSETVSTAQKDQKVVEEYKKYKQKTLSAVERDYLNSIREVYQLARVGENN